MVAGETDGTGGTDSGVLAVLIAVAVALGLVLIGLLAYGIRSARRNRAEVQQA